MFKPKLLYNSLLRAILVILCPAFFAVQLFCNFGISGNPNLQSSYCVTMPVAKDHHPVKPGQDPVHRQAGFRLNKHFQPESLPSYNLIVIERPIEYINSRNQPFYSVHFISSPSPEAQFLRGPPPTNDFA